MSHSLSSPDRLILFQSAPADPPLWLRRCLNATRDWAAREGFSYLRIGDEILELIPPWFREKVGLRWPILCDLGRLILAEQLLAEGASAVLWLDADCYPFASESLGRQVRALLEPDHPPHCFALELWVQPAPKDSRRLKLYRNACNALSFFRAGDPLLPFYRHCAERTIRLIEGPIAPQLIGPKLLSALRGPAQLPLTPAVGSASPLIVASLAAGNGAALDRLQTALEQRGGQCAALNLCGSYLNQLRDGVPIDEALLLRAMDRLDVIGAQYGGLGDKGMRDAR